jgi:peptidyl-dipeptidase A
MDVDRSGDVRVLSNNAPNERWAGTMLHEFGHAAYDVGISTDLPWLLHEPAHMLTTEAIAMLFGRLVRDAAWLRTVVDLPTDEAAGLRARVDESQRGAMLVFVRWVLVMTHFERGLYEDPDGDHDRRWWDLVERFQLVRRPDGRNAPDWAAKIHLAVAPVYYQNYVLGELLASQLHDAIERDCGGLVGQPEAGHWLTDRIFRPGSSARWDQLVERATGAPLSARHFIGQFVNNRAR